MMSRAEEKTFMLIGASRPNVPIIDMARDIGYSVVVTDINPDAEGLKHGDYNYNVSAKDVESLAKIAVRHGVDCVYSGTDINFSVGVINDTMSIDGFPLILGLASEYKSIFRRLASEAGMPLVKGYVVSSREEAIRAFEELGTDRAVIKAVNLGSSLGVKKVRTKEELILGFDECSMLSGEGELIVEEFINGVCLDANGLVIDGRFYPCGIVHRSFVEKGDYFVQKEAVCPTALDVRVQKEMYSTMSRFSSHLGIRTSPVKADFLYDGERLYMLEFAPRFHGEMGFLHMIPGAISIRAMEAYLGFRYTGVLDESLLEERVVDRAVMRAEINGEVKSNYDIGKYVISFERREPIEVYIR